jgi:hypothetical protein
MSEPEAYCDEFEAMIEDFSDSEAPNESATTALPQAVAVQHIEDMVLSFLTQLAIPGGFEENKDTEESDLENAHILRTKYKIEIRLADRKKIDSQG